MSGLSIYIRHSGDSALISEFLNDWRDSSLASLRTCDTNFRYDLAPWLRKDSVGFSNYLREAARQNCEKAVYENYVCASEYRPRLKIGDSASVFLRYWTGNLSKDSVLAAVKVGGLSRREFLFLSALRDVDITSSLFIHGICKKYYVPGYRGMRYYPLAGVVGEHLLMGFEKKYNKCDDINFKKYMNSIVYEFNRVQSLRNEGKDEEAYAECKNIISGTAVDTLHFDFCRCWFDY